jgi:transcriptional regulator with XRE-family HTH domain
MIASLGFQKELSAIVPDFIAHLPQGELEHKPLISHWKFAWHPCGDSCKDGQLRISSRMAIGAQIQAWRLSRGLSPEYIAAEAGISLRALDEIEAESLDPSTGTLERLAKAMKIPVAWLFANPKAFDLLFQEPDASEETPNGPDPITERILTGSRLDRSLYVMLTALIQSGEPKLLRAAEMSLQSLVKQSKQSTVPWQNRPSGHFEPPSD